MQIDTYAPIHRGNRRMNTKRYREEVTDELRPDLPGRTDSCSTTTSAYDSTTVPSTSFVFHRWYAWRKASGIRKQNSYTSVFTRIERETSSKKKNRLRKNHLDSSNDPLYRVPATFRSAGRSQQTEKRATRRSHSIEADVYSTCLSV